MRYTSSTSRIGIQQTAVCDGCVIDFTLRFSRRRTLAISVLPDSKVIVRAPVWIDISQIQQFVQKRAPWIQKQQQHFRQFRPQPCALRYVDGEEHLYLGRQYHLKLVSAKTPLLVLSDQHLIVYHPEVFLPTNVEWVLYEWYKSCAEVELKKRFEICLSHFSQQVVMVSPEFRVRRMKSRWGSYASSGRVTLNLELIKAPVDCIDYVITHELCHAIHLNHSIRFYRLLEKLMPDYRSLKKKLNSYH